jgi:hypothetical protein
MRMKHRYTSLFTLDRNMQNALYENALTALKEIFGMPRPLVNKSGARFLRNGAVTIYHTELAPGNETEIAFNVQVVAAARGVSAATLAHTLDECRTLTGRPVEINKQQNWPRIGIATEQELHAVMQKLSTLFKPKAAAQ